MLEFFFSWIEPVVKILLPHPEQSGGDAILGKKSDDGVNL